MSKLLSTAFMLSLACPLFAQDDGVHWKATQAWPPLKNPQGISAEYADWDTINESSLKLEPTFIEALARGWDEAWSNAADAIAEGYGGWSWTFTGYSDEDLTEELLEPVAISVALGLQDIAWIDIVDPGQSGGDVAGAAVATCSLDYDKDIHLEFGGGAKSTTGSTTLGNLAINAWYAVGTARITLNLNLPITVTHEQQGKKNLGVPPVGDTWTGTDTSYTIEWLNYAKAHAWADGAAVLGGEAEAKSRSCIQLTMAENGVDISPAANGVGGGEEYTEN